MRDWVDAGILAGMSATMAYWLLIGTTGMGILTWRNRRRFAHWVYLTERDRADAILNAALFGFMAHATFQRVIATYSFAAQEWRLSPLTVSTAPINLLWALVAVAGLMWWICFYLVGPERYRSWWCAFVGVGVWLGISVSWYY